MDAVLELIEKFVRDMSRLGKYDDPTKAAFYASYGLCVSIGTHLPKDEASSCSELLSADLSIPKRYVPKMSLERIASTRKSKRLWEKRRKTCVDMMSLVHGGVGYLKASKTLGVSARYGEGVLPPYYPEMKNCEETKEAVKQEFLKGLNSQEISKKMCINIITVCDILYDTNVFDEVCG